jgi:hypothetical protein
METATVGGHAHGAYLVANKTTDAGRDPEHLGTSRRGGFLGAAAACQLRPKNQILIRPPFPPRKPATAFQLDLPCQSYKTRLRYAVRNPAVNTRRLDAEQPGYSGDATQQPDNFKISHEGDISGN